MRFIKPHTDQWFAGLDLFDPKQAKKTRLLVGQAKTSSVCSICGGKDSWDYHVKNSSFLCKEYATLRLCSECIRDRQSRHGDQFERLV